MKTYKDIIRDYKCWRKCEPDTWVEHCQNANNLEEAIKRAASSEDNNGKRNPHQLRLKSNDLKFFGDELVKWISRIEMANTFDELWKIVNPVGQGIKGIGELAIYDVAIIIGQCLNPKLEPNKIYLHAGTRKGSWNLLGRKRLGRTIDKSILPNDFNELKCWEIEEILCIYKDCFSCINNKKCDNKSKCKVSKSSSC